MHIVLREGDVGSRKPLKVDGKLGRCETALGKRGVGSNVNFEDVDSYNALWVRGTRLNNSVTQRLTPDLLG